MVRRRECLTTLLERAYFSSFVYNGDTLCVSAPTRVLAPVVHTVAATWSCGEQKASPADQRPILTEYRTHRTPEPITHILCRFSIPEIGTTLYKQFMLVVSNLGISSKEPAGSFCVYCTFGWAASCNYLVLGKGVRL